MADGNELVKCGLLSREEGASGWEHVELVEPGSEAEKRTMVCSPVLGRSYRGESFLLLGQPSGNVEVVGLVGNPKFIRL